MSKESIQQELGRAIYALRKKRGFTQKDLAGRSKLHVTFLSGIEKGNRGVTVETANKIAGSLGVSLPELFATRGDLLEGIKKPTPVTFIKLGGTWDMQVTKDGLRGSGALDDESFSKLESDVGYDERSLCKTLEERFGATKPVGSTLGAHLPWVPDIGKLISGDFLPLFSGDSSHYRPAVMAPVLSYLLKRATTDPTKQIIAGMGTDTVDILLPYLDAFLFDKKHVPPILISGANLSHREEHSDAPRNFHDLAETTRLPLASGAYYVFDRTIFKGGDVVKVDPSEQPTTLEGQLTFFAPARTQTRIGFLETGEIRREGGRSVEADVVSHSALEFYDAIKDTTVVHLGDMTDLDEEIAKIKDPANKAVVIVGHALGNVPYPIRRAVIEVVKKGKLVMSVSRALRGVQSERYALSLLRANRAELADTGHRILDGGRLSSRSATALLVRSILEKRDQKQADALVQEYKTRTF